MKKDIDSFLKENGIDPKEVEIKGASIAKKILPNGGNFINYGNMVKENDLYPVIYTVLQDGSKVFRPQYLHGKYLTENQIKHLYEIGYFNQ